MNNQKALSLDFWAFHSLDQGFLTPVFVSRLDPGYHCTIITSSRWVGAATHPCSRLYFGFLLNYPLISRNGCNSEVFPPHPRKKTTSDGLKFEGAQQESAFGYSIPTLPNLRSTGKPTQRTDVSYTDVILELFFFFFITKHVKRTLNKLHTTSLYLEGALCPFITLSMW